jgi:hypothetical protein
MSRNITTCQSLYNHDVQTATSEVDEKAVARQRRLDSFVSPTLGGTTDESSGVIEVGRWKFKLPKFISRLRPPRSIDPNGKSMAIQILMRPSVYLLAISFHLNEGGTRVAAEGIFN